MRKQTKIAAVVSAAALLALGASITSFAAQKGTWKYEDGEWYCYDKDGYVYENTFCLSNGKEFYVGDDGALVRSSWVDDGNDWYFVNSAGEKITNDWRLTTPYDDEDAEEQWFYFQSTGKMAKDKKLVIKGKTYFFDADGKMLTGWVQVDNKSYVEANTSVDDANGDTYYCDETGARLTSTWVWDYAPGVDEDDTEEEEHYFYLKSNGKVQTGKASNIKGQTYFFDEEGKMLTGWVAESDNDAYYSIQGSDDDEDFFVALNQVQKEGKKAYYCTVEDGHMKKDKWIKLWNPKNSYAEDEDTSKKWFYLNKNGEVYVPSESNAEATKYSFEEGQLAYDNDNKGVDIAEKRINGKDYLFNMNGEMLTGFWYKEGAGLLYLGDGNDGIVKTGAQTIKDDMDESYRFYFETKGDSNTKGVGITGNKNGKLYYDGMLITAKDYRYELAKITDANENDYWFIINQSGSIQHTATQYKEDGSVLIDAKKDEDKAGYVDADFNKDDEVGDEYEYSIKGGKDALNDVDTTEHDAKEYVYSKFYVNE